MHIVEICASNRHHGTGIIMEQLEKKPETDVIEFGCLGNCKQCMIKPFAIVNSETVYADNPQELMEKIETAMKKNEADQSAFDKLLEQL